MCPCSVTMPYWEASDTASGPWMPLTHSVGPHGSKPEVAPRNRKSILVASVRHSRAHIGQRSGSQVQSNQGAASGLPKNTLLCKGEHHIGPTAYGVVTHRTWSHGSQFGKCWSSLVQGSVVTQLSSTPRWCSGGQNANFFRSLNSGVKWSLLLAIRAICDFESNSK